MNIIPAATSITALFVTKTDFYTKKETGEIRASVQVLSPIPADAFGNGRGYELTEFPADPSVLEAIDFSNGPAVYKFESQIRPTTDRFGRTTNTQVLTRLIEDAPAQRQAPAQGHQQAKPADSIKS